jgi:hypothetical protein
MNVAPLRSELAQAGEHDAAGWDGRGLRVKGRQTAGDHVGVHEFVYL